MYLLRRPLCLSKAEGAPCHILIHSGTASNSKACTAHPVVGGLLPRRANRATTRRPRPRTSPRVLATETNSHLVFAIRIQSHTSHNRLCPSLMHMNQAAFCGAQGPRLSLMRSASASHGGEERGHITSFVLFPSESLHCSVCAEVAPLSLSAGQQQARRPAAAISQTQCSLDSPSFPAKGYARTPGHGFRLRCVQSVSITG